MYQTAHVQPQWDILSNTNIHAEFVRQCRGSCRITNTEPPEHEVGPPTLLRRFVTHKPGSSPSIVAKLRAGRQRNRGSIPKHLYLLQSVFLDDKMALAWSWPLTFHLESRLRMSGATSPPPYAFNSMHRDNSTLPSGPYLCSRTYVSRPKYWNILQYFNVIMHLLFLI
jgi:hypothetical protein